MNFGELIRKHPFPFWGSVVSVVLLVFAFVRNSGETDAVAELDRLTKEANRASTNVVNSASLVDQLKALRAANKAVESRLAKASDLAGNSQYFYRLEAETGVKEQSLTPGTAKLGASPKGALFVPVPFSLTVQGRYPQLLSFIQKLEGAAWFGRITYISIRQAGELKQLGEPSLVATMNVELLGQP